jgi:hypothetical protein
MKTIKDLLQKDRNITENTVYHDYDYLYKAIVSAVKEASEQAFNAAREEDIEFMAYRQPKYVNAQEYIKLMEQ